MDEYERDQERGVNWVIAIIVAIMGVIWLNSCTAIKEVPIETIRTEYKDKVRDVYHYIYVKDSANTIIKNDTVWCDRWRILYRDKAIHDTLYIERKDSIDVPVLVEKKLTWWQRKKLDYAEYSIGIIVILISVIFWIVKKKGGVR